MQNLEGKVAIVTGGGSGIGRATSLLFAQQGARVVVADISLENAQATVAQIAEFCGEAIAVKVDVRSDADCQRMVEQTLERFGQLDIAFNNAGIGGYPHLTADYGVENWQRVIDINLTGVFNCMVHELKAMEAGGKGGAIVNTASIMGLKGTISGSAYCASKHGVIGLTKASALEAGRHGIRINAVCPGYIETPMTTTGDDLVADKLIQAELRRAAIRRMAKPQEVAELVAWLSSDKASFVSGSAYTVDGGVTAG
ncbi:SDR family NAD(P)-dependent oxidoreductase [Pseudomonas schmalbachii]|uniref:SDR family oxidoreductase n=1 Tax=Pseudomonas schmalbachii TaxID=2816993 RepID=A0ABS3TPT2_9PSED|nr:SDR family NAD(P)-dependent oxidoreductase [Pseudomonas schmalbachii]MBO3275664.1 SDR family oxidoreductase [Pseudomonas schmalbachii]